MYKMKNTTIIGLISLIAAYALNIAVKFSCNTCCIKRGEELIRQFQQAHNDEQELNQLYPAIEGYCKNARITTLSYPYNLPNARLINIGTQRNIINSLNKAIGVYKERRRYCYILFTVDNDKYSVILLKTLSDVFIKFIISVIGVVIGKILELM